VATVTSPVRIERFGREEFLSERWDYRAGEHVTLIGRTQSGKTTLAFELMDEVIDPDMPALVLVMKPKDPTPTKWGRKLDLVRVPSWPPPIRHRSHKINPQRPRGWLLWPPVGDIDRDKAKLRREFHRAFAESYSQGSRRNGQDRIIFADEIVAIANPKMGLGLANDVDMLWMQGSGMGQGLWAACQRPFEAPQNAYEQSIHLFIFRSTDRRNLKRYGEIGGIDPDVIHSAVSQLHGRDCFYIRRSDYTYCVVGES
jgi:energy-coupling factor transporter ATP-binding protein EcfA2